MLKTQTLPTIENLTLEEKIGQMFLIDFSGYKIDDKIRNHLTETPWGGVILFTKNVKSREQLSSLNKSIVELNKKIPLLITVDQEGGIVVRADFPDMNLSPGNIILGKINDHKTTKDMLKVLGLEIRELGFHLTYAPVADVNCNPDNPIIGVRAFGDDPDIVGDMTVAAIEGLKEAGIGSCAKHFPGHGDTSFDSHLLLSRVDADMDRIETVELPPFKKAIEAGVDMIMTAHIVYPQLDESELPATLSHKILTELLREKMGFEGVIITDSMAMKAISDNYGPGESAVMSVKAGSDIVMMLGKRENQELAFNAVMEAVRKGDISIDRINESVERILKLKDKLIVNPPKAPEIPLNKRKQLVEEITDKGITVLYGANNIPINEKNQGAMVLSPNRLYYTEVDETVTRWSIYPFLKNPERIIYDVDHIEKNLGEKLNNLTDNTVFIEIYTRGPLPKDKKSQWEALIGRLKESGNKVIIISLLSPYNLPENADTAITGYNYSPVTLEKISGRC